MLGLRGLCGPMAVGVSEAGLGPGSTRAGVHARAGGGGREHGGGSRALGGFGSLVQWCAGAYCLYRNSDLPIFGILIFGIPKIFRYAHAYS